MDKNLWKSNLPEGILDPRANVIANNKSRANGSDLNWLAATIAKNKELAKDPNWIAANKERHNSIDWFEVSKRSGATRKEIGEWLRENDPEEFKRYFGYIEQHSKETIEQMKESATQRWNDPEKRKAHSERLKGIKKPKVPCQYCGKEMSAANLKRHGHTEGKCIK